MKCSRKYPSDPRELKVLHTDSHKKNVMKDATQSLVLKQEGDSQSLYLWARGETHNSSWTSKVLQESLKVLWL